VETPPLRSLRFVWFGLSIWDVAEKLVVRGFLSKIGGSGDAGACYLIQDAAEKGAIVLSMGTFYVYTSAERNTEQIVIRRSSHLEGIVF
jgi:hypothetical protein